MLYRINLLWPKIDPSTRIIFIGGIKTSLSALLAQDIGFAFQDVIDHRKNEKQPCQNSQLTNMSVNSIWVLSYDHETGKMVMSHDGLKKADQRSALSPEQKKIVNQDWLLKRASNGKLSAFGEMVDAAPSPIDLDYQGVTGVTALCVAACYGHADVVAWLIQRGADINRGNAARSTPLYFAAEKGNLDIVRLLVEANAEIDVTDDEGVTPLYGAVLANSAEVAEYLLDNGADVDKCDVDDITPLYVAAKEGDTEMASLLLKKGANVNKADNDGVTPLYVAAREGDTEMVKLLLKKGADINRADKDGMTPLYVAAVKNHPDVVERLLKNHAELSDLVQAALAHARKFDYEDIVDMLQTAIAKNNT